MTTPQTPLGKQLAKSNGRGESPQPPRASPLSVRMPTGSRGEDIEIPMLGRVRVELVGETTRKEIAAAVFRRMADLGIERTPLTSELFESETATRTLAEAMRDPDDHAAPFGTFAQWDGLDADMVNAAWQAYGDVRERLDPLSLPLTEAEKIAIEVAVKKKDAELLRSFGVVKLSAWLASTAAPPATSPTPSSSSSESPPES